MPSAPSPASTAAASLRGSRRHLGDDDAAGGLVDRAQIGERAADVDPDDEHVREMIASGKRGRRKPWPQRRSDQTPLDAQDPGSSMARRRRARDRAGRGCLGVDRARQEAPRRLRGPGRGERGPRPARDRRGHRRADGAPGLLSDDATVLEPARSAAGGEAGRADPGDLEYSFFAVSGAEANERAMQMARPLLARLGQADQAQGDLARGRLPRRDDRHLRRLRAAAPGRALHDAARAGLRRR